MYKDHNQYYKNHLNVEKLKGLRLKKFLDTFVSLISDEWDGSMEEQWIFRDKLPAISVELCGNAREILSDCGWDIGFDGSLISVKPKTFIDQIVDKIEISHSAN